MLDRKLISTEGIRERGVQVIRETRTMVRLTRRKYRKKFEYAKSRDVYGIFRDRSCKPIVRVECGNLKMELNIYRSKIKEDSHHVKREKRRVTYDI